MKVSFINDWQYLFNQHAIGGRFASFTFIHVAFIKVDEESVDGLSIILLGLGVKVKL